MWAENGACFGRLRHGCVIGMRAIGDIARATISGPSAAMTVGIASDGRGEMYGARAMAST